MNDRDVEKNKRALKERPQVPITYYPTEEEYGNSQPEEEGSHLVTPSKEREPTTQLFNSRDDYIKVVRDGEKGTLPYPTLSLEERKERKKERILTFLVSNTLYGIPLPVEMRGTLVNFASRVPEVLLDEWVNIAVVNEDSPRRNGKLQRALWKSMVLYIANIKHMKPNQQLTLRTDNATTSPKTRNPSYVISSYIECRKTKKRIHVKICQTCENYWSRYGCVFPRKGGEMEEAYQNQHRGELE